MEKVKYIVNEKHNDITLKEYFTFFYLGKSMIYKLFLYKRVYLNGNLALESDIIHSNDVIEIEIDECIDVPISSNSVEIVYEDDYILVVNKPVGIIIHSDGNDDIDTLVNRVANYYKKQNINRNVRYLHRIDKETSGLVLFAKDFLTYSKLSHDIENHTLKREYLALVHGYLKNNEGVINIPIGRDRHIANKYRVGKSKHSKDAITHYYVVKRYEDYTYIRLLLETGRTHQIRVHMSSINHPLLGDVLYDGKKKYISRVALHSFRITMIHPYSLKEIVISKKEPTDMLRLE